MKVGETLVEWLPLLVGLAWKSLVVFALAGAALLALRRASASARHLVCLLTLIALLALPGLSLALPGWHLPVPIPQEEPIPAHQFATLSIGAPEGSSQGRVEIKHTRVVGTTKPTLSSQSPVSAPLPYIFPWSIVLPVLWLLGFVLALLRPFLGFWGIGCLSRASVSMKDTSILALTRECASALTLKAAPALCQAASPVPMTWGWRHPVILLPLNAQTWPEERLRAVLLHELAHVRRRDWLGHRFADFVCALYWFHPLVWLMARRLRAESEIACDDLVLTSGIAAPDYARHLLDVARALRPITAPVVPQAAIAMARTAQIEGRLKMILDASRSRRTLTRRVLILVLMPGAAVLIGLAMLRPAAKAASKAATNTAVPVTNSAKSQTKAGCFLISPKLPHLRLPQKKAGTVSAVSLLTLAKMLAVTPKAVALPIKPVRIASSDIAPEAVKPAANPIRETSSDLTAPVALPLAPTAESDIAPHSASEVSVELAGITNADKLGSAWWSSTGMLLSKPIYNTAVHRDESHTFGGTTKNVIFAFRLPANSIGATVAYKISDDLGSSSEGSWLSKMKGQEHQTEAQAHSRSSGVRVVTVAFPASLTQTNIRVGIASSAWKVAAIYGSNALNQGGSIGIRQGNSTFLFSPASETKGGTVISIATDATDDLRVVAVDAQGKECLPDQPGDNSIGTLDQITVHFSLPLAQIKEIRVEARPFRWVEIKDIALQPVK